MNCLCILEIKCLLVLWFVSIFSHSLSCIFVYFFFVVVVYFFAVSKFINFIRSHLFDFAFISIVLGE